MQQLTNEFQDHMPETMLAILDEAGATAESYAPMLLGATFTLSLYVKDPCVYAGIPATRYSHSVSSKLIYKTKDHPAAARLRRAVRGSWTSTD